MKRAIFLVICCLVLNSAKAQWQQVWSSPYMPAGKIYFADTYTGYINYTGHTYKTTDKGLSWQSFDELGVYAMSMDFPSPETGYCLDRYPVSNQYNLRKTTDQGNTWFSVSYLPSGYAYTCIRFINNSVGFAGGRFGMATTVNGGISWNPIFEFPQNCWIDDIEFISENTGLALLTLNNGNKVVFKTNDSGISWSQAGEDVPQNSKNLYIVGNTVFLLTADALYKSSDEGIQWNQVLYSQVELHDISFRDEDFGFVVGGNAFGKVIIAQTTDGGSSWRSEERGDYEGYVELTGFQNRACYLNAGHKIYRYESATSVAPEGQGVPSGYSLSQNYPNPFNPMTKISYTVPKSTYVRLTIYDILGKEIEKLVNEQKNAGNYNVEFDGSKLSSGIYMYKLQTDNFIEKKKMVLTK